MNAPSFLFVLRVRSRSWLAQRQSQYILITVLVILLFLIDLRITKQFEPFALLSDISFVHSGIHEKVARWLFPP